MPPQLVDVVVWEVALRHDKRLTPNARLIAHCLAERFRAGNGCCQLSLEGIASAANVISLASTRNSVTKLRLAGWLEAKHVSDTARKGLVYRPAFPRHRTQRQEQPIVSGGVGG
jgi:hypothetical protein